MVTMGILPGEERARRLKRSHWLWLYLMIRHCEKRRIEDLANLFGTYVKGEGIVPLVSLLNPEAWEKLEEWKRVVEVEKSVEQGADDLSDEELRALLDHIDAKLMIKRVK